MVEVEHNRLPGSWHVWAPYIPQEAFPSLFFILTSLLSFVTMDKVSRFLMFLLTLFMFLYET